MSDDKIVFTDRYQALGVPYPDPETMCKGDCEGLGVYPVPAGTTNAVDRALWEAAEAKKPAADGWHFVKCPECNGTGKRAP